MGGLFFIVAVAAGLVGTAYAQATTLTTSNAAVYAGGTTSVGPDGFTTVPYPPSCNAAMYGTANTYAVYDSYGGEEYLFQCGPASAGTTIASVPGLTWRDCFQQCDAQPMGCTSFSFNGGGNYGEAAAGGGTSTCNLKGVNPGGFTSYAALVQTRVAAVRRSYGE